MPHNQVLIFLAVIKRTFRKFSRAFKNLFVIFAKRNALYSSLLLILFVVKRPFLSELSFKMLP